MSTNKIIQELNEPFKVRKEEVIYLFFDDLNELYKREYNFNRVSWYSFKESSMSREEFLKANLVIYVCYENYPRHKILKSRYF